MFLNRSCWNRATDLLGTMSGYGGINWMSVPQLEVIDVCPQIKSLIMLIKPINNSVYSINAMFRLT